MSEFTMFNERICKEIFNDEICIKELLQGIYKNNIEIKEYYLDEVIKDSELEGILDIHVEDKEGHHMIIKIEEELKDILFYALFKKNVAEIIIIK